MKSKLLMLIPTLIGSMIIGGCTANTKVSNTQQTQKTTASVQIENSSINTDKSIEEQVDIKAEAESIEVDYDKCFEDIEGCMVIYEPSENKYNIYNEELASEQASPCSTFKIISGLMGLEEGVVTSSTSTMQYNDTIYPIDLWNKDLTFKEAFQCSCVWYFRKVIDQIGREKVAKYIGDLNYGNCDLTSWEGSSINPTPDTNGFWLESSLKISPIEQVEILANIFEGQTSFSTTNIELMKALMVADTVNDYCVYGKTGTGNCNGWYVGLFENDQKTYYFATRIIGNKTQNVSGNRAKEITLNMIQQIND